MASSNLTVPTTPAESVVPGHLHLDNTLGAAFIGLIFAAILFGVTNVQSLIYYQSSGRDPMYMKWTIALLWSLDALHLALITHVVYFYLVTNFTNLLIITDPTWSLCLHVLVTVSFVSLVPLTAVTLLCKMLKTLSDFIVRLYYTRRVWMMSKQNWFLTLGALTFTSVTFISGMGFGITIFSYSSTAEFTKLSWVLYTSLGSAVGADVWVAVTLCYFLARNRTGFKATDTKVNTLILYIINTGMLTSLCAIASFVSFATMPHNYVFIGFYFSLSKLYFNSLLATLNARERLREGLSGAGSRSGGVAYQMPRFVSVPSPGSSKHAGSLGAISVTSGNDFNLADKDACGGLAVTVKTETDYHTDEGGAVPARYTSVLPL